jgi:hypothetical protein
VRNHPTNTRTHLRPASRNAGSRSAASHSNDERGVIITLVAVFMLFVMGAMAALSIDVVTLYTARSEAQLAADGGALAGARALANSGMTSKPTDALLASNAENIAIAVATQVAKNNLVGGRDLATGEVTVSFPNSGSPDFGTDPQITVRVQRTDLPTFFARIWGSTQLTVTASATAEAYNPSGANASFGTTTPVAPICVKPWLLPNIDPTSGSTPPATIFDPTTGAITNPSLITYTTGGNPTRLQADCLDCSATPVPAPTAWYYYPGDPNTTFPPPTQSLPSCSPALTTDYQKSIAGCIPTPISCNSNANYDTSNYPNRNLETRDAVDCLTHGVNSNGDEVDNTGGPVPPFRFLAGTDNPVAGAAGNDVMVSDSLVTVPVYNSNAAAPVNPVTIIGFVQLFLNPRGRSNPANGFVRTEVINLIGCGTGAAGQPILGNGASPVAVRLISP